MPLSTPAPAAEPGRIPKPAVSPQALKQVGLFKDLPAPRLDALAQACSWHSYEAGYSIPSRYTTGFCVVASGRVLISTYEQSGRQVAFQSMGAGDCFGAVAILLGPDHDESVEAITLESCLIAQLDPTVFLALVREDSALALAVLRYLAQVVRRFGQRIVEFSTLTVRGRLQAALLRMAHGAGVQANRARLEPAPRHHSLASYVGTSREQITRELSWLQRQGLVARDGKALVLCDVARLQQWVDQARLKG